MTTTTYPSQGSLDAMGSGVDKSSKARAKAPATQAEPTKSLFRRGWEAFLRNRQEAALMALARSDYRLAQEVRMMRDRAEWQA